MNLIQRQWQKFAEKSIWGKFWDVLFLIVIILLIVPDGRMMVQRTLLKTGLMGTTKANASDTLPNSTSQWKLMDLNGNIVRFGDFADRPVFLNHWATWCPPCRAEMPSIISLIEAAGDRAHYILLTSEDPEKVQGFLDRQGWDLPVYFPVEPIPTILQAQSLPTTLVIDRSQTIIHRSEGMRDWGSKKAVELVIGEDSIEQE